METEMPLDELHARRLATVVNIVESAFDRMELVFGSLEKGPEAPTSAISLEQIRLAREKMESVRRRLRDAVERFGVRTRKPEPRQILAAELSSLWVVLENARPERMKGYGRKFSPADRAAWEDFIQYLLRAVAEIRRIALASERPGTSSHAS
jgi:hypothetical protein